MEKERQESFFLFSLTSEFQPAGPMRVDRLFPAPFEFTAIESQDIKEGHGEMTFCYFCMYTKGKKAFEYIQK